jgi:hypothetical protein
VVYSYSACKNINVEGSQAYVDKIKPLLTNINGIAFGQTLYSFIEKNAKKTITIYSDGNLTVDGIGTALNDTRANLKALIEETQKLSDARHITFEKAIDIVAPGFEAKSSAGAYAKGEPIKSTGHPAPKLVRSIPKGVNKPTLYQTSTNAKGTGEGINTEISFNPDALDKLYAQCSKIPPYLEPPEVLFHELVHGLRVISGVVIADNVPEEWHMDNSEEFCAILATNIFRSSRRSNGLRYEHHFQDERDQCKGYASLPADLSDSGAYYVKFKPHIVKWFSTQRDFCIALAKVEANFNPMATAAKDLGVYLGD